MVRVQVLVDVEERERFRHQARREGVSLSAWLRQAGLERLTARTEEGRFRSVEELRGFFAASNDREQGREPEWEEHLAVIGRSIRSGAAET